MKLVKLQNIRGYPVYINPDHVATVYEYTDKIRVEFAIGTKYEGDRSISCMGRMSEVLHALDPSIPIDFHEEPHLQEAPREPYVSPVFTPAVDTKWHPVQSLFARLTDERAG